MVAFVLLGVAEGAGSLAGSRGFPQDLYKISTRVTKHDLRDTLKGGGRG
jgi:hypothetical protein